MKISCDSKFCPCAGQGWTEIRRNSIFHECIGFKSKSHSTLSGLLECKDCKSSLSWQGNNSCKRKRIEQEEDSPVQIERNISIRVKTLTKNVTVLGSWHTINENNGWLDFSSRAFCISDQFEFFAGVHKVQTLVKNNLLSINVYYSSSCSTFTWLGNTIESFALQFADADQAREANHKIQWELCPLSQTIVATPMELNQLLLPGDLLHILTDPELQPLIQQAEIVLKSQTSVPDFVHSLDFSRLVEKVQRVLNQAVNLL